MPILSINALQNDAGPAFNPREEETFSHTIRYEDPLNFCNHVSWSIEGDIPTGVSVSLEGVISGKILNFAEQPSCKNDINPLEEMEFDCSNANMNGLYKNDFYDFNFIITRTIEVGELDLITEEVNCGNIDTIEESSNVYIREVKCFNKDNDVFLKRYLETSKTSIRGHRTSIFIDGKEYTDYEKAKLAHQGPFECPS